MKEKLNILMISQYPLTKSLGGPKTIVETAESYRFHGHNVDIATINDIVGGEVKFYEEPWRIKYFPEYLKKYILEHHQKYDVIEYEAIYLPYNLKPEVQSLLVARNVLLELHFKKFTLPYFHDLKSIASHFLKGWRRNLELNARIKQFMEAMTFADVVNVSNYSDKKILAEYGINQNKIVVQPYGISQKRKEEFDQAKLSYRGDFNNPVIAFVGTFDRRKGAVEFPEIIRTTIKANPKIKFKLLGVIGMFLTEESIFNYLGDDLKANVIIHGKYNPQELPTLLADCTHGIFPSYLESFGFGALEMMAMGLPVIGYDCPGIDLVLPDDMRVPRGNVNELINLLNRLTHDYDFYTEAKITCAEQVPKFIYETQTNYALEFYKSKR